MIHIESEVFHLVSEYVKAEFPNAFLSGTGVRKPHSFPCVSVVETENCPLEGSLDSSGEEHFARLSYEIQVWSNSASGKKAECKGILSCIDRALGSRNFTRVMDTNQSAQKERETAELSVYRISAHYSVVTDGKYFYRPKTRQS